MQQLPENSQHEVDRVGLLLGRMRKKYHQQITGEFVVPEKKAEYAEFPASLDSRIVDALYNRGIKQLYSHQRQAWDVISEGGHAVLVTPTASGKTLCYNLPVIQSVLKEKQKALYLFPTKALSQDQQAEILALNQLGNLGVRASTFDGDTPGDARKAVRTHGDIVISNPDMLHQGILPHHTKWAQFFENLQYVVIDELHIYRGVFGSHVANVIRRLKRVCAFYGVRPQFICCSATIANPESLAGQLTGEQVTPITRSGAPHGKKHILFWNPPMVNPELGIRASARSQSTKIARMAIKQGLKSIVFAQSRLMVEVITKYLKDVFDKDPRKAARVESYRGGYLPNQRRNTEKKMRSGNMSCVVATSALELGVDIGSLDICILNGYPGTIAGSWQRFGRAGRRNQTALGVLVASSTPLDQFIIQQPEYFMGNSPEHARIDPEQLLILLDHIRCAAFELPFQEGECFGSGDMPEFLAYLEDEGLLHKEGKQWHWIADAYPANSVNLRSVSEGNFVVIDIGNGRQEIIAEVDFHSAPDTLYEGAIYLIQAEPWQVEKLDWVGRKAFVTKTQADYYTDAIDYTKLKILAEFQQQQHAEAQVAQGEVHLVRRIAGYKKIRYYSHENIGYGNINLPDQEMHTTAIWWQLDSNVLHACFENRWQALDAFLGAAYAMHHVAALLAMTESYDIGRAVGNSDGTWFSAVSDKGRGSHKAFNQEDAVENAEQFNPSVFLYDNVPGGLGISSTLFDIRHQVVTNALQAVQACNCPVGCPACIGPILTGGENRDYSPKQAVQQLLTLLPQKETNHVDIIPSINTTA